MTERHRLHALRTALMVMALTMALLVANAFGAPGQPDSPAKIEVVSPTPVSTAGCVVEAVIRRA